MRIICIFISVLSMLLSLNTCLAQEKGLRKKDIPELVREFIQSKYPNAKRIRYYLEKDNEITYIESEFRFNDLNYSLRFLEGELVETEVSISFENIEKGLRESIRLSLDSLFGKYRILECQKVNPGVEGRYELHIKSRNRRYFELFYTAEGILEERKELYIHPIPSLF